MSGLYVNADILRKRMMLLQEHDGKYLLTHEVFNTIWNTPLADVRENVHGEWIKDEGGFDTRDCFYHCSKCGRTINIICGDTLENYQFCHCGADMRKGETNG